MEPYSYVGNNPIMFTDPTGMSKDDIVIMFKDQKGKTKGFVFDGTNAKNAPKDEFVQNFIEAYEYNIKNGGGDNLKDAAFDKDNRYFVGQLDETIPSNRFSVDGAEYIKWSPTQGLQVENGDVLSPATVLEHEFDHSVDHAKKTSEHRSRTRIEEENRVMRGSETKTAKANGEISKDKKYTRFNYLDPRNKIVPVHGPTSTKIRKESKKPIQNKLLN